jgi:hypothetical protein
MHEAVSHWTQLTLYRFPCFPTVSSNAFGGDLPAEIGTIGNLEYLFASAIEFTPGVIPEFLASLTKLEELGLKSTNRLGEIPAFLGDLANLVLLDLDDNMLFGPLPSELGQLTDLEFLLLNRNELSGDIPTEFEGLTSLRVAFLDQTALSGSLELLCELPAFKGVETKMLMADCAGENPEIACDCCTLCCSDLDQDCNKNAAIANMELKWEANYYRTSYILGAAAIFAYDSVPVEP